MHGTKANIAHMCKLDIQMFRLKTQ